jgi:hypothetical protein
MAQQRRMLSSQIVCSDAFLDMPQTTQLLYFQLVMQGDDDGFVGSPKRVMKMIGANDDDFKILVAKRFLLTFESGVVVIKHWLIHNTIRLDRYHPTQYQEEKNGLFLKENKAYTEVETIGSHLVAKRLPEAKLSKVNLIESNLIKDKTTSTKVLGETPDKRNPDVQELWEYGLTLEFSNTKQHLNRYAITRLLKGRAVNQLKKAAKFSQDIRTEAYAPQVNNWMDLEDKYLKLRDWVARQNNKSTKKSVNLNEFMRKE